MPIRDARNNPMQVPQPELLRAVQRLAGVVGSQAALLALNEIHFTEGSEQQTKLATFVAREGPFAQWREMITWVYPGFSEWGTFAQEEALLFMLCVTHVWLTTGQTWYPNEPTEKTLQMCKALSIRCSNAATPSARALLHVHHGNISAEDAEVLHMRPDQ